MFIPFITPKPRDSSRHTHPSWLYRRKGGCRGRGRRKGGRKHGHKSKSSKSKGVKFRGSSKTFSPGTRPGSNMTFALFPSNDNTSPTTFRILADNSTTYDLIDVLYCACSSQLPSWTSSQTPQPCTGSITQCPRPEQVIQYYMASSIALTLDSYNNSASIYGDKGTPAAPLPTDIDYALLGCLNRTIGATVPLADGAISGRMMLGSGNFSLLFLGWCAVWWLSSRL